MNAVGTIEHETKQKRGLACLLPITSKLSSAPAAILECIDAEFACDVLGGCSVHVSLTAGSLKVIVIRDCFFPFFHLNNGGQSSV